MNTQESKERILSRSAAAKQEVVQKARKFLKKLTPEEKDVGTFDMAKGTGTKGSGSKGMSGNISSPLELKSLVIISRETRLCVMLSTKQKIYTALFYLLISIFFPVEKKFAKIKNCTILKS